MGQLGINIGLMGMGVPQGRLSRNAQAHISASMRPARMFPAVGAAGFSWLLEQARRKHQQRPDGFHQRARIPLDPLDDWNGYPNYRPAQKTMPVAGKGKPGKKRGPDIDRSTINIDYGNSGAKGKAAKKTSKQKKPGMGRNNRRKNAPPVSGGQVFHPRSAMHVAGQSADRFRITLRSFASATTATTTGIFAAGWLLGDGAGTGSTVSLDAVLGKLATFYGMYDWFRIARMRIVYHPTVDYSTNGWFAMTVDPNPRADEPSSVTDVTRHLHKVGGDCKQSYDLTLTGKQISALGSGVAQWFSTDDNADLEWRAPGVVQIYVSTDKTSGATEVGKLELEFDFEFKGLNES